jgi:hypothetical protein
MKTEDFINAFNMGRSYSGMPHGFNSSVNWKYKDVYEALEQVKNNVVLAPVIISVVKCPECLYGTDQEELDMFGGLCETCANE